MIFPTSSLMGYGSPNRSRKEGSPDGVPGLLGNGTVAILFQACTVRRRAEELLEVKDVRPTQVKMIGEGHRNQVKVSRGEIPSLKLT